MTAIPDFLIRLLTRSYLGAILFGLATVGMAQDVPIVQPGAPGDPVRELSAEEEANAPQWPTLKKNPRVLRLAVTRYCFTPAWLGVRP